MKNITFEEMLNMEVQDLLHGYPSGGYTYYYKDGDGVYHEIVELDLLRGGYVFSPYYFFVLSRLTL